LASDCSLDSGVVSLVSSSARVVYAALAGDLAVAVRQPTLGARIWRAFQRRRELLMTTDFQGKRGCEVRSLCAFWLDRDAD